MTSPKKLSYSAAGVNIDEADAAKDTIADTLKTTDKRVFNQVGAFASLVEGSFPGYKHPVLVLKTEEPGTKQLLAFQHDRVESICQDMINHLINDIAMMGAVPLYVQDAVICGKLEKNVITRLVAAMAAACKAQDCVLTGGETSEQPGVLNPGTYILTSSVVGIVDKERIIDGSAIKEGDVVLAIPSNGLHTNGYSLVRALMRENPNLVQTSVGGEPFIDVILKPHMCYFQALRGLYEHSGLHGMAHITGSGIQGNLERVLPKALDARIDLASIKVLPIFRLIRDEGDISDDEMLRTYNMGVGVTLVASPDAAEEIIAHLKRHGHEAYRIGMMSKGKGTVVHEGQVKW